MPAFSVNMKHTPESCPMFNEEFRKKVKELASKREEIARKYKIKVLSAYTSVLDHLIFFIVEAPSQSAVEDYYMEIGMAFWNNIEIRQVQLVEDVLKRL